jgi:UDP-N-acetylmuramyl pentapeptide phosphotransferase/UDP-N-acetylglucosamine-1-phosphate transferase
MGLGSGLALAVRLWWSLQDAVPPFWLWALPLLVAVLGLVGWLDQRRAHRAIKARIERSAMRPAPRPDGADID